MKRSLIRIVVGYLCAVISAALCQAVWWTLSESSQHRLGPIQAAAVQMFEVAWVYAFFLALLPFSVGVYIERERGIDKPEFFVAGAMITGILLILPLACCLGGVFDQSDASFLERCFALLPRFGVSAVLAGLVYSGIRKGSNRRLSADVWRKLRLAR